MKFSHVEGDVIHFDGGRADDLYINKWRGMYYFKKVIVHEDLTIQSQVYSSITLVDIEIAINLVTLYQEHVRKEEEKDTLSNYLVHRF